MTTLTDRILATLLGALIVWAITKVVTYLVQRSRLKAAILTDILLHQKGIKQQDQIIKTLLDEVLKVGKTIPFPIRYASEEWILYRALQRELPFYLNRELLRKIIRFYHHMWELDHSMLGFAKVLEAWDTKSHKLTLADMEHLKRRSERMSSMSQLLTHIRTLDDLPDDYQESMTMQTVLHLHNGHANTSSTNSQAR